MKQKVVSSFACTYLLAVTSVVAFLDLRRVSCSLECTSMLLSMCIDASESIANSRSSGILRRSAIAQESRMYLLLPN